MPLLSDKVLIPLNERSRVRGLGGFTDLAKHTNPSHGRIYSLAMEHSQETVTVQKYVIPRGSYVIVIYEH